MSTFDKPTTWEIFSTWPEDIRRSYLKKLYWNHNGTFREIADMFGTTDMSVRRACIDLCIPVRKKGANRTYEEKGKWKAFLIGTAPTTIKDILPEETVKMLSGIPKEDPDETKEKEGDKLEKPEGQKEVHTAITNNDEFVRVDKTEWKKEESAVKAPDLVSAIVALFSQLKEIGVKFSVKVDL